MSLWTCIKLSKCGVFWFFGPPKFILTVICEILAYISLASHWGRTFYVVSCALFFSGAIARRQGRFLRGQEHCGQGD